MTSKLAHKDNGFWTYWTGEPRHQTSMGDELFELPRNAGDSYSHQKLATFGLRIVGRDDEPAGKRVVETVLGDKNGKPWEFLTLEDIPEPEPEGLQPLRPYQFEAMVIAADLEPAIMAAFDTIENPLFRSIAVAKFKRMDEYHRNDPLFHDLAPVVGLTDEQIDDLWRDAAQL